MVHQTGNCPAPLHRAASLPGKSGTPGLPPESQDLVEPDGWLLREEEEEIF